jgi:16S rRNA (uracil1498-N3)-methyltransferase
MLRAYCSGWDGGDGLPVLDSAEIHHLVRVRRVRPGETVEVLNGRGDIATCRIAGVGGRDLDLELVETAACPAPALHRHLLVALPKGKTLPALLHKAVELGVDEITPLLTRNSEVGRDRAEQKKDRLESVLVEALKQSGNPWMPRLNAPRPLEAVLGEPAGPGEQRLCAALQPDARPLWDLLEKDLSPAGTVAVFVGPEGDFSEEEYEQLRAAGCRFATLGPLVLKVETAASLVMGALGLWSCRA